jgi:hypothetical protein
MYLSPAMAQYVDLDVEAGKLLKRAIENYSALALKTPKMRRFEIRTDQKIENVAVAVTREIVVDKSWLDGASTSAVRELCGSNDVLLTEELFFERWMFSRSL